jgi:purine-cytosine permease-like protein
MSEPAITEGTVGEATAGGRAAATAQGIELRSIDWVPHTERHGKAWHVGPVWFSGNAELTTMATGVTAISLGGNLLWTMIALLAGAVFGTFFSAFHSAQGPQLGLPQMIQSRAQFGYLGVALLVLPASYIMYAGYNVFNGLLPAEALSNVTHVSTTVMLIVVTVVALAAALWGYDLIHRTQRYLTALFLVVFTAYTIALLVTVGFPHGAFDLGGFRAGPFLGAFALAVSYQLSWAPYVSDYSRYLPAAVGQQATFWWTYLGMAVSGIWMFWLGAIAAAPIASQTPGVVDAIRSTGDALFGGWGAIVLIAAVPALVIILAMNMYGGALVLITIADSVKKIRPGLRHRVIGIVVTAVIAFVASLFSESNADFLTYYNNLLVILLYLFGPWTAINLADYYLVRRGHYAIREIFKPEGMYGRWGWRGLTAYIVGFGASAPFWVVGTWYVGPVARMLNSADISFFVGLGLSGLVYLVLARSLDLDAERRVEAQEGDIAGGDLVP